MLVAVCSIELYIPASNSLKEKRHVVKSIIGRIQSKLNASVAEVDFQDLCQRSAIGIAIVGNEKELLEKQISMVRRIVDDNSEAETASFFVEYL